MSSVLFKSVRTANDNGSNTQQNEHHLEYRSNVVVDKYDEHLMMYNKPNKGDAAVKEFVRICYQADRRPDLVLS